MGRFLIMGLFMMAAVGIYSYLRLKRFASYYGLRTNQKSIRIGIIILTIVIALCCINIWSISAVIVLHVVVISAVLDVIAFVCRKIRSFGGGKTETSGLLGKQYESGRITILIATAIVVYGFFNISNIMETHYTIHTDKNIRSEGYRIALITDVHYATIQDKNVLKEKISDMNAAAPDIVVLGGDIVEEGTSMEDMQEVFEILSGIGNQYGIYYVYGNHDRQPYTGNRTFTDEELENTIRENGIQILDDKYVNIGEDIILAGREDAAWGNTSGRASSQEILWGADRDKYIIMVDHQPIEAEENDEQGVDLELSGHTHAGQIWPVGLISELTGVLNYGRYEVGNCDVIVSSGFAGWGYPIRTGGHSEFVIIDIK